MKHIGLIIIAVLLFGCNAQKRLERIYRHHPELRQTDTIWHTDTFRTQGVSHDTAFVNSRDTVVMRDGKLTVKYYYHRDSVYLQGACAPDTFVKKVPYIVQKNVVPVKLHSDWWKWLLAGMAAGVLGIIVIKRLA